MIIVTGCSTTKHVPQVVEHHTQDSIYITQLHHDSIYIYESKERIHDTLYLTKQEFRYRLLRDTIYRTKIEIKRDSIPYEVRVVETKDVRYVPPWIKTLAWIGAIALLLILLTIILKLTIR